MAVNDWEKELSLGDKYLEQYNYKESLKHYKKASELNPNSDKPFFGMAEAARGIPKINVNEIIGYYKKAIELNQKEPLYYTSLGAFYIENNMINEAEHVYTEAAKIDEQNKHLYLSELAIEYYSTSIARLDDDSTQQELDEIKKKALNYFLRAIDLEPAKAQTFLQN